MMALHVFKRENGHIDPGRMYEISPWRYHTQSEVGGERDHDSYFVYFNYKHRFLS